MTRARTCISVAAILIGTSAACATTYKVYYLGGQSNMDGLGRFEELPASLNAPVDDVMIYHGSTAPDGVAPGGRGVWAELRPGHGVDFRSDGESNQYGARFGVELSFARRLREIDPDSNIAIIKYSRGGTSIDAAAAGRAGCWDPDFDGGAGAGKGINQYDHFLATLRNAFAVRDIDGDGEDDELIPAGIIWMQGESDAAHSAEVAGRYGANLDRLMDLIRAALRVDDLPVVIGRISDSGRDDDGVIWTHGETVRAAQAAYCESDPAATLVTTTDSYGYSDPYHYDTEGYLDLGRTFADAIHALETQAND
jgi:hypothetical protein